MSSLRVLALTDDPPTRALLARVLADLEPTLAEDPSEAIAAIATAPPDLVFVDVSAFGGAALAVVHHVKALAPEAQVHALARPAALEAAAAAVALGGAGVLVLPLEGDEVLTAVADADARRQDRDERERLRRATSAAERLLEAAREVSSLGSSEDRSSAAARVASILQRALGASDVAVYLAEGADLFVRGATQGSTANVPTSATAAELDGLAVAAGWSRVTLAAGGPAQGHVLVRGHEDPDDEATRHAAATIGALAAVPLAMVSQAEASRGGTIKDPGSSAYSFAYYVDVAGREIDRARRHGRRFAIATIALGDDGSAGSPNDVAGVADRLLDALGDTAILARVDEHEFHALLPETDGLGGHACRRRILAKLGGPGGGSSAGPGLEAYVGVASFPHDGTNLSQLLRVARRRSDACRASPVRRTCGHLASLDDMLWALEGAPPIDDPALAGVVTRPLDLPPDAARALVTAVLGDAARAGAAMVLAAGAEGAQVGGAVRQASASARDGVAMYVVDIDRMPGQPTVEALAVLSEHATYALIARESGGRLRGIHSADPLLADLLAERVGRTAGLRLS